MAAFTTQPPPPQPRAGQYESGRAIPNNFVIQKMERALGTRLRGGP
eukprot:CAMPEP_0118887194 /NCGR_PEP_ID=MMETSP1163-20130328/25005_1 /TAXON_ID=124430 /ORGANISM="Phaeomonas parva, Strain CCMP2877" /LENGTH=45 /DNA_ID= /DNA_START= /DNA_END= /DNA_ORIENTATION=